MWPLRYDLAGALDNLHLPSSSVFEAEDPSKTRKMDGASSASETSESESGVDLENKVEIHPADIPSTEVDTLVDGQTPRDDKEKSDPDSDSTIGAAREEVALPEAEALVPPQNVGFLRSYIAFAILLMPFLYRNKAQ
jgi:1-phosphatidylinositol-3-phosphate 5-kinase